MALASYEEANDHLDGSKVSFASDVDAAPEAREADAIVIASLADIYPDHVSLWVYDASPTPPEITTPELVRQAASLLMAGYRYNKIYSEEVVETSGFADSLISRAMEILTGIRDGTLTLTDVDYDPSGFVELTQASYWPNDTTVVTAEDPVVGLETGEADRRFTMTRTF